MARSTVTPPAARLLPHGEEPARIRATIARARLFNSLPLPALEDLTQRVQVRKAVSHETVVSQDDAGDSLFLIMSGRVKVVIFGENGREVTLSVLRVGEVFGEVSLFDGGSRSATCVAMEATTLLVLSREHLLAHLAANPRTALNLLGEMAQRLRRADDAIAQLALCDVNERLIRRLIGLAREDGNETNEGLVLRRRPTQQELANMIGSCRETISRAFNQLARDGLIVPRGRALVVTRELVQRTESARGCA